MAGAGVDELADPAEQLAATGDLVQEGEDGAALACRSGDLRGLAHDPPPPAAAPTTAGFGSLTSAPSSSSCMIA